MEMVAALPRIPPAALILPALADGAEGILQLRRMMSAKKTPREDTHPPDVAGELPVQHPRTAAAVDHAQRAKDHPVHRFHRKPRGGQLCEWEPPHKEPDGKNQVMAPHLLNQRVAEQAARVAAEGLETGVVWKSLHQGVGRLWGSVLYSASQRGTDSIFDAMV